MKTLRLIFQEHISFKRQIFKLAKSDLVKTYQGAALGWFWAVVKPMLTVFVFWFTFTIGLRSGRPINGYPYFLWLIAGMIPWFYMSDMITQGAGCIRKYSYLVNKMKFPISIIPTYVSISKLFVHWVLLAITIVIFAMFGYMPDIYYLQIPVYMLMMFMFFTIWAFFGGMMSALSKDFLNLVRAVVSAIFWLSGVIYDVNQIKHDQIRLILQFNPVTVVASGYRNTFIYKKWFFEDTTTLICFGITFFTFFILSLWAFKRLRKEIPDVL